MVNKFTMINKWEDLKKKMKLFIKIHNFKPLPLETLDEDTFELFIKKYFKEESEEDKETIMGFLRNKELFFDEINDLILETAEAYKLDINSEERILFKIPREETLKDLRLKVKNMNSSKNTLLEEQINSIHKKIQQVFSYYGFNYPSVDYTDSITLDISTHINKDEIPNGCILHDLDYTSLKNEKISWIIDNKKNRKILKEFFKKELSMDMGNLKVRYLQGDFQILDIQLFLKYKDLDKILNKYQKEEVLSHKNKAFEKVYKEGVHREISNLNMGIDTILFTLKTKDSLKYYKNLKQDLMSMIMFFTGLSNYYNHKCEIVNRYNEKVKKTRKREAEIKKLNDLLSSGLSIETLGDSIDELTKTLSQKTADMGFYDVSNINLRNFLTFTIDLNFNADYNFSYINYGIELKPVDELIEKYDFHSSNGRFHLKLTDENIKNIEESIKNAFPDAVINRLNTEKLSQSNQFYIKSIDLMLKSMINL